MEKGGEKERERERKEKESILPERESENSEKERRKKAREFKERFSESHFCLECVDNQHKTVRHTQNKTKQTFNTKTE